MTMSLVTVIFMVTLIVTTTVARVLPKRSLSDNLSESYDYEDYPGKQEQYPVATKRAALLLDRLMVALQKAVDEQGIGDSRGGRDILRSKSRLGGTIGSQSGPSKSGMDLQRRGPVNGSVYWRCYFNAVTCFKKK
ncbi:uncharacterized protein AstCC [Fopius arisanus]|uniref:GalT protein n=1 Tax=Fopius arisanus TaxID=64838 RepID=A0A0C9QI37_9HYME|nr:PREDICTED: uncharacterized protein LOC105270365 [Fopius arisanus]XP_011309551.1 PREDICTED: uncharacterized protein LOC105270365 [Fopius arisanus]